MINVRKAPDGTLYEVLWQDRRVPGGLCPVCGGLVKLVKYNDQRPAGHRRQTPLRADHLLICPCNLPGDEILK